MPGKAYGLPAAKATWVPQVARDMGLPVPPKYGCAIGGKLAGVAGTTCAACYADNRGQYGAPSVHKGQTKRVVGVHDPRWIEAMLIQINRYVDPAEPFFRWHDSGDLLGDWHLEAIATIASATPWVNYWLPTREALIVSRFLRKHGDFPSNLTVRVSATKVDAGPPTGLPVNTSTVHSDDTAAAMAARDTDALCDAAHRGGQCGPCRACWDRDVDNVSYGIH